MTTKQEGQEQSVANVTAETWDAFKTVLQTVPAGALFTVNTVRVFLDWADIPPSARGGLFNRAAKAGLMEPAMHLGYFLTEPSVDAKTHAAGVRVYRRCAS